MPDHPSAPFSRRRFLAAAMGAAFVATLDAQASPLLGLPGRRKAGAPNAWIEVDPEVFQNNLRLVQAAVTGGARICAIMKADAYGIGIDMVMPGILKARLPYVGIASTEEARMVRACGFKGRLMRVRAATLEEVEDALSFKVEELVGNLAVAQAMGEIARRRGRTRQSMGARWSAAICRHRLAATWPPSRMLTLAQPMTVSRPLRARNSASAPQRAVMTPLL